MLDINIKKLLISSIPSNISIDGYSFPIKKTLGSVPLNKLELPTVNIKFINEGDLYYRSIDDCCNIVDTTTTFNNINTCVVRYTVASTDVVINTSNPITYKTGTDIYTIPRVPVIDIIKVGSYIKNIDYKLSDDHTSIIWIGNKPSDNTIFNIEYKWINSGYYISNQLVSYLIKDFKGRIFNLIRDYGINIIDCKGVKDISDIYTSDSFNAFSFDFTITYPFTWSTTISEEDAVISDTFTFDLIVNDINVDKITCHIDE